MELALGVIGWFGASVAAGLLLRGHRERATRLEMLARVSHELRGPITAARLGLQLGARVGELSSARLRAIDLELGRAGLALDDLTALGDDPAHAGALGDDPAHAGGSSQVVDVGELLSDSVEAWRAAAAVRGVQIAYSWSGVSAVVCGDRFRLAQATGNLLANAIEHGRGEVAVRGRTHGSSIRVEVTDGGPGLPAPVAELTARPRAGRGSRGRGLAIAASIAEAHGGRLAAAPSERGARLVLELPAPRRDGRGPG